MNASIKAELGRRVQVRVRSGLCTSAAEVVREALRLLREHEELRQARHGELKRLVHTGITDADAGTLEVRAD